MAVSSGTFDFQPNLENDELILECFERLGFSGDQLVPIQLNSAKRSLNLLMLDWISKSTNLWTLRLGYISLQQLQTKYILEPTITDVLQVNLRTFTRQLNGVASSNTGTTDDGLGGGDVEDAFDGDDNTSCDQDPLVNGNISYTYNEPKIIRFVGIQSIAVESYDLVVEYFDNGLWFPLFNILEQEFPVDTLWFDVDKPVSSTAYRVRETGGAILNLSEIFFTDDVRDFKMSSVSRDTYLSFSQKFLEGRPTTYYFDKQITPELNLWYPPRDEFKVIQYSYINIMQDAGGFFNIADVPARMYPALACGLTWMLAVKYAPEVAPAMKEEYEQAYATGTSNDIEHVPIRLGMDIGSYYAN